MSLNNDLNISSIIVRHPPFFEQKERRNLMIISCQVPLLPKRDFLVDAFPFIGHSVQPSLHLAEVYVIANSLELAY